MDFHDSYTSYVSGLLAADCARSVQPDQAIAASATTTRTPTRTEERFFIYPTSGRVIAAILLAQHAERARDGRVLSARLRRPAGVDARPGGPGLNAAAARPGFGDFPG